MNFLTRKESDFFSIRVRSSHVCRFSNVLPWKDLEERFEEGLDLYPKVIRPEAHATVQIFFQTSKSVPLKCVQVLQEFTGGTGVNFS